MCEPSTAAMSSGRAHSDDPSAAFAAFRTQIDHPVGGLDHVQIVLDDQHAAAVLDQPLEGGQQLGDVVEVQAGRGLVEDEQRALARSPAPGARPASRAAPRRRTASSRTGRAAGSRGRHRPAPCSFVHQPRTSAEECRSPPARSAAAPRGCSGRCTGFRECRSCSAFPCTLRRPVRRRPGTASRP